MLPRKVAVANCSGNWGSVSRYQRGDERQRRGQWGPSGALV